PAVSRSVPNPRSRCKAPCPCRTATRTYLRPSDLFSRLGLPPTPCDGAARSERRAVGGWLTWPSALRVGPGVAPHVAGLVGRHGAHRLARRHVAQVAHDDVERRDGELVGADRLIRIRDALFLVEEEMTEGDRAVDCIEVDVLVVARGLEIEGYVDER